MSSPASHSPTTTFSTPLSSANITTRTTHNMASNNSSNATSSSISATHSTTSRKAHHPPLEAIQTQKAQASVTFRPVSSTSSELEEHNDMLATAVAGGGGLTPYSPYPSHPGQQYQPPPGKQQQQRKQRDSIAMIGGGYSEPPLNTASTGHGSFPFTPSTLVDAGGVPSPMGGYREYSGLDGGGQFQTIPLSPTTRPEKAYASRSDIASPDFQQHQQQRQLQPRASNSRRQQQQQQTYPGTGTGTSTGIARANSRPYSTGSINTNSYYYNNKHNTFSTSKQQGSQGMELTYSSSSDDPRFQHLPNLWQVLHRKTQPPVCLFNFYLYMRDDEKSSEEVDFWLDVTAHEVLWRLYVRATKRRMAMAEREMRMERERVEREERERVEREEKERNQLELAAYEAQVGFGCHGLDYEKSSAHKKQPSVTLDMYEPHWSAANRYLEMSSSEGSSIVDPATAGTTNSTGPSSPTTPHQHYDLTRQYFDDTKEASDQILMVHNALKNPTVPPPQQQHQQGQGQSLVAGQRVHHVSLPGAVPASWAHPSELETQYETESGVSEGTSTGAHPPTPAAKRAPSGAGAKAKAGVLRAGMTSLLGKDAGIAMAAGQRVGTDSTSITKATTTTGNTGADTGTSTGTGAVARAATAVPRRAMTSGSGGVTREDLQRSAERIYYKYLIPQAEKRVRIPGEVRQRVAMLMDSKMMLNQGGGSQPSLVVTSTGNEGSDEVEPSSPVLKRKNNLVSPTTATAPQLSPNSDLTNEKSDNSKPPSNSEPTPPHRLTSPTSSSKEIHRLSSTSIHNHNAVRPGPNSTLQQPDQDLGLVFAEAREIVFEGMELYYFPRFLKARAYGNMVPSHRLMRCVTGLFFLFVGFAVVLTLIFLNIRPRALRAWAMIPIFIGAFLCTTFQFNICPILVAMGVSETKWMQFAKVKEPYLIKLHRRRGVKVVVVAVLYTVCMGIIFGAVPGHRL